MSNLLKILIVILIAVAIVAAIVIGQVAGPQESAHLGPADSDKQEAAALPQASGDVDAAVDAFLLEATGELSAVADEQSEADLLNSDSQALSNYGSSYVESEF